MTTREKLMEFTTQRIIQYLMKDRDMEVDEAMNLDICQCQNYNFINVKMY